MSRLGQARDLSKKRSPTFRLNCWDPARLCLDTEQKLTAPLLSHLASITSYPFYCFDLPAYSSFRRNLDVRSVHNAGDYGIILQLESVLSGFPW